MKVTTNKEIRQTVLNDLKRNKEKYGKRYCPCSIIRNEDTICPCKEFREMEEGTCHCQLYSKEKFPSHVDNSTIGYTVKSFKINNTEVI